MARGPEGEQPVNYAQLKIQSRRCKFRKCSINSQRVVKEFDRHKITLEEDPRLKRRQQFEGTPNAQRFFRCHVTPLQREMSRPNTAFKTCKRLLTSLNQGCLSILEVLQRSRCHSGAASAVMNQSCTGIVMSFRIWRINLKLNSAIFISSCVPFVREISRGWKQEAWRENRIQEIRQSTYFS